MNTEKIYDVIGIGIGPFNLGLAALLDQVEEVEELFFEQKSQFEWHPGMLLEGTVLNSSFLADLVTFADPTSPYSMLNYFHKHNRMFQFYFNEKMQVPRREYDAYGKWVSEQLSSCRFGFEVSDVEEVKEKGCYKVSVKQAGEDKIDHYYAKHVVLGVGNTPIVPPGLEGTNQEDIYHTENYSFNKQTLRDAKAVTIIGSGQSAAEVFYDLLQDQKYFDYRLSWFTRSPQFFQAENAKVAREIFSPDYVDYFRSLDFETRMNGLPNLDQARKGIEQDILYKIYDLLYHRSIEREDPKVTLQAMTEMKGITEAEEYSYVVECFQWQKEKTFYHPTDKLVLGTGYKPSVPKWIDKMKEEISWEDDTHFEVDDHYRLTFKDNREHSIFTLVNIDHSHGTAATNLTLSVLRNQSIINAICGYDRFPVQKDTVFQQFFPD